MAGSVTSKASALAGEMIDAAAMVRVVGGLLIEHGASTARLARMELETECARIECVVLGMQLFTLLLGLTFLFGGVCAISASWDTPYRLQVTAAMPAIFAVAALLTWRKLRRQSGLGKRRFEETCAELGKTVQLLRSHI